MAELCAFCGRKSAKYTCPKCNGPYCSATCFQSNVHGGCSETFYKRQLKSGLHASPTASPEERQRMLSILQRFEDEHHDHPDPALSMNDEDDDLAARLQHLDLNQMPPEEIWELLKPAERMRFIDAINDPKSDFAQNLVATQRQEPWWVDPNVGTVSGLQKLHSSDSSLPSTLLVPISLMNGTLDASHPFPIWSLVATIVAYAYCIRHLCLRQLRSSPSDFQRATEVIVKLVPFLVDQTSRLSFTSLDSMITDLWSRFSSEDASQHLFQLLLKDAEKMLRPFPPVVVPVDDICSSPKSIASFDPLNPPHRHARTILALSDLRALFEGSAKSKSKANHTAHKITYYAMHVLRVPSTILTAAVNEIQAKIEQYEEDSGVLSSLTSEIKLPLHHS